LIPIAVVGLAACQAGPAGPRADGGPDGAPSTADAAPMSCGRTGFAAAEQRAERDDDLDVLFYTGLSSATAPLDRLTVDFYFTLGALDGTQVVDLAFEDPADCHTCVALYRGCSAATCALATVFLPASGLLEVEATGGAGDPFTARLDARLVEVTIEDQHATPVPGGEVWCLEELALSATIDVL